jgi:hypothetical protein
MFPYRRHSDIQLYLGEPFHEEWWDLDPNLRARLLRRLYASRLRPFCVAQLGYGHGVHRSQRIRAVPWVQWKGVESTQHHATQVLSGGKQTFSY